MLYNSHILTQISNYGFREELLTSISLLAILFSIFVIVIKNPIVSVLFLIGLFLAVSFYLISLGFYFLGLSYILVYIGAVSILFIFILMLINIRISELLSESRNSIPLVVIITVFISVIVSEYIPENISNFDHIKFPIKKIFFIDLDNKDSIPYVSCDSWDNHLIGTDNINSVGSVLYTNYCIWLILTSIILLLAMTGCIVITMRQ